MKEFRKMNKYAINVTSECVNERGEAYNSDHFEHSNELSASSARDAAEQTIRDLDLNGVVTWYEVTEQGAHAMIAVPQEDGGEKDFFVDVCDVTL